MSGEDEIEMSEELGRLIQLALGIGLNNLQELGSLSPLVLSAQGTDYGLAAIAADDGDDVMGLGAAHVAGLPAETGLYAFVFEGKLNVEGAVVSAVIVQAGERGRDQGHMVYQPFDPQTREAAGEPEYAGAVEQYLRR